MDFGAISRAFERKILRPTNIFENFIVVRNGVGVGRFNGVGVGRNFSFSALQLMQRPTPVRYGVGRRCNAQRHAFLALRTSMVISNEKFCGRENF